MSRTSYARYKYTPDEMGEQDFLERFVVRTETFNEIFDDIRSADYSTPNQHYILIGQRGQGKTTLLRRIQIAVQNDEKLSSFLLPVKFAEEQYQIRSLCRLWEEVADYLQNIYEDEFETIHDEMETRFEDDDYDLSCFAYLEERVRATGKTLLLLIDNIDELLGKLKEKEQRQLREILLTSATFRIIGGSTRMIEQHYDYGKPFYEFFKIVRLKGLNYEESVEFLRVIGRGEQRKKIESIIENTPERIETLRQLTGGVPRTLIMLFDIFVDDDGNAFEDLLKILDDITPLYKDRMDNLPPALQDIVHTIAMHWDGIFTKEIAQKTRMDSKTVSAQLKQLEKYQIITYETTGKNKIYKIQERFFNIWYLMRFGRKKDRQRVEWLVKFLLSWYSHDELKERAHKFMDALERGCVKEAYAYHMCEALSYTGLDTEIEYALKHSGENVALNSLAWFYFERAKDMGKAVELSMKSYANEANYFNVHTLATILLWSEKFKQSYETFLEWLNYAETLDAEADITVYLILLMAKGQYYQAKKFFEMPEYQLKERYKPLWYALMTLMQDEFPNEIKKMGSELETSVSEILKKVEEYRVKYAL